MLKTNRREFIRTGSAALFAPVDKDSPSSSRRAYKLTRKGKEAAQW